MIISCLFLFIIIFFIIDIIVERNNFIIKRYNISNIKIDKNIKIVLLSDLHSTKYGNNNKKLIKSIVNLNPDYIFVCGDMLIHKEIKTYFSMEDLLIKLNDLLYYNSNIPRIYCVFGNHEKRAVSYQENSVILYKKIQNLKKHKIIFLFNESVDLTEKIVLHGLDIDKEYYYHINPKKLDERIFNNIIFNKNKYNILMSHHPGVFKVKKNEADLTLSGHLHGGMIYLPFIGGLILTDLKLKRKFAKGIYKEKENNKTIIISAGLGDHKKSIRINNMPEIVLINLQNNEKN